MSAMRIRATRRRWKMNAPSVRADLDHSPPRHSRLTFRYGGPVRDLVTARGNGPGEILVALFQGVN